MSTCYTLLQVKSSLHTKQKYTTLYAIQAHGTENIIYIYKETCVVDKKNV